MTAKFIIRQQAEPCFILFLDELVKGGPYIGPRGGKWADPQHKIPWKEGKGKPVGQKKEQTQKTRRQWLDHMPGMPKTTVDVYRNPDGSYKAERKKVHQEIFNEFLSGITPPPKSTKKVAIVMMGGPASGKTTLVKKFAGEKFNDFVNVNPDDVKDRLPEYNKAMSFRINNTEASAKDAAQMVHTESSDIAGEVYNRAVKQGLNVVVDGTGKDADKHTKRIEQLREAGYHVQLLMPDVDIEEAVRRSENRAERTGRYVPAGPPPPGTPDIIRSAHKVIPGNFERIARVADAFALYDSRAGTPVIKWSGTQGAEDTIHDVAFVGEFKKRAGSGAQAMAKSLTSDKKKKRPHVDIDEITKRIEESPEDVGREDEKRPKAYDRKTGAVQVIEDIDYAGQEPLVYK